MNPRRVEAFTRGSWNGTSAGGPTAGSPVSGPAAGTLLSPASSAAMPSAAAMAPVTRPLKGDPDHAAAPAPTRPKPMKAARPVRRPSTTTRPRTAPARRVTTTIPVSRAGFWEVPSRSIVRLTSQPGARSTTRSPTATTSDGPPVMAATASATASAMPAARTPATDVALTMS